MAQDDYIRTALRVPPDLHKEIHQAADKAGRSFNAELLERLRNPPEHHLNRLRQVIDTQTRVVQSLGTIIDSLASKTPAKDKAGEAFFRLLAEMGAAFEKADIPKALDLFAQVHRDGQALVAAQKEKKAAQARAVGATDEHEP